MKTEAEIHDVLAECDRVRGRGCEAFSREDCPIYRGVGDCFYCTIREALRWVLDAADREQGGEDDE